MNDRINVPSVGEFVRIRRPTTSCYITVLIIDSREGRFDQRLNLYVGVSFPFELECRTPYSFFTVNVIKNFGNITVNELIKTYPEYVI